MTRDPGARARFLREARITAGWEHPSIVPVHELGYRDNTEPSDYATVHRALLSGLFGKRPDLRESATIAVAVTRSRRSVCESANSCER